MRYILREAGNDGTVEVRRVSVSDYTIPPNYCTFYTTEADALEAARKYNFMYHIDLACQYLQGAHSDTVANCASFAEGQLTLVKLPHESVVFEEGIDDEGYDENGYDIEGYDRLGYDENGYDEEGVDGEGYDRLGYDRSGLLRDRIQR